MGTTIGIIGLFVAIALLVVLAFKGHSVIIAAPIAALIAVLFSYGLKGHFMASYTITYMSGFANYAKNYFPIYLFGAVFAKLMDISGNAQSIAQFCTLKLGKSRAVLSVVLTCAILTYGGVSLFVVAFVMLPVAIAVFRAADIPEASHSWCYRSWRIYLYHDSTSWKPTGSEYHSNDLFWNRLLGSTCPWYHCNCYYVWRWHGMAVLPY